MRFWYRICDKPRGLWLRKLEFGFDLSPEEVALNPDLRTVCSSAELTFHNSPNCGTGYTITDRISIMNPNLTTYFAKIKPEGGNKPYSYRWEHDYCYLPHRPPNTADMFGDYIEALMEIKQKILEQIRKAANDAEQAEVYEEEEISIQEQTPTAPAISATVCGGRRRIELRDVTVSQNHEPA